jgi:hypothetical protein
VGPTVYFLTATFLAAQAPEAIPVTPKQAPVQVPQASAVAPAVSSFDADCDCCEEPEPGPIRGLFLRLRSGGLFAQSEDCGCEERTGVWDRIHSRFAGLFNRANDDCCACAAEPLSVPSRPAEPQLLQKRMPSDVTQPQVGPSPLLIVPADQPMSRSVRPTGDPVVWIPAEQSARKPFRPFNGFLANMMVPFRVQENLPPTMVVSQPRRETKTVMHSTPAPMPAMETVTPIQYQPVAIRNDAVSGPIRATYRQKVGHDAGYTWITGQLQRVSGRWILHYADSGSADRLGGRVLLASDRDLSQFRDGDLVSAHGSVLDTAQTAHGPMYLATSIHLIER